MTCRVVVRAAIVVASLTFATSGLAQQLLPALEGCPTSYVIGPEDVLDIAVWDSTELTRTVPVRPDGKISLPLLNDIQAAGLTPMQILQCTTANAAKFFGGDTGAHIGKIDKGNFADLVILNSNPLDDIAHASAIDTVIKNGVVYPANSILH